MEIYSIGFTQKTAEDFFESLNRNRVERLLDIRLNNTSQLAGFAKAQDLSYFLRRVCRIEYKHEQLLAPTQDILHAYKKQKGDWSAYQEAYLALISDRKVEEKLSKQDFTRKTAFLCSERTADHCHRRLALEYLKAKWGDLVICHL